MCLKRNVFCIMLFVSLIFLSSCSLFDGKKIIIEDRYNHLTLELKNFKIKEVRNEYYVNPVYEDVLHFKMIFRNKTDEKQTMPRYTFNVYNSEDRKISSNLYSQNGCEYGGSGVICENCRDSCTVRVKLASYASGVYYIRIVENGLFFSKEPELLIGDFKVKINDETVEPIIKE